MLGADSMITFKHLLKLQQSKLLEVERNINRLEREIESERQELERYANAIRATQALIKQEESNDDNH
jgi:cell division protein FtsL